MNECSHPHHQLHADDDGYLELLRCAHMGTRALEHIRWLSDATEDVFGHIHLPDDAAQCQWDVVFTAWEEAEEWLLSLPVEEAA